MLVVAITEVLSISMILPFLTFLTAPESLMGLEGVKVVSLFFNIKSNEDITLIISSAFITSILVATFLKLSLIWVQMRLSVSIGSELSSQAYYLALHQALSHHASLHSSEIISGLQKASALTSAFVYPLQLILSSLIITIAVLMVLMIMQPIITVAVVLAIGMLYLSVALLTNKKINQNSNIIARESILLMKAMQEGLGAIRDIILSGSQTFYSSLYRQSAFRFHRSVGDNMVLAGAPKVVIEGIVIALIAIISYFVVSSNNVGLSGVDIIPILGLFAISAQRLLPQFQNLFWGVVTIKSNQASTEDALNLLEKYVPKYVTELPKEPMTFTSTISLRNIGFRYGEKNPWIFRRINLDLRKGSKVGVIGKTGSGKSTLVDLIAGLFPVAEGEVLIDGVALTSRNLRAWQRNIAYVPQSIFIADVSIAENIALGEDVSKIDMSRVRAAAEQAQLGDFLEITDSGLATSVGEGGVSISGGQRQRIGIARALYKNASLIVLDEATSALDEDTEKRVIEVLMNLSKDITIIIISHNLTTLRGCDFIIKIKGNAVLMTRNPDSNHNASQ